MSYVSYISYVSYMMNNLKSLEIAWTFHEYIRTENSNYKNENIKTKYLNNMQKTQFLNLKNSLL